MADDPRIVAVDRLPSETTFLFRVRNSSDDVREAILVRSGDGIVGWLNYCQHLTHIRLDKGDGAEMRNGELLCTNHGAYFEADSGYCNHGPCKGAYLNEIEVTVEDGTVFLEDDRYEYVGEGGIERDETDLGSTSNVEM